MPIDAAQLGIDGTREALRQMLAQRFDVRMPVDDDAQLFDIGAGLSSLEGIEFLCEVERAFGVSVKDLEWWVYETPTLTTVARHLIDLTHQQRQHAT